MHYERGSCEIECFVETSSLRTVCGSPIARVTGGVHVLDEDAGR